MNELRRKYGNMVLRALGNRARIAAEEAAALARFLLVDLRLPKGAIDMLEDEAVVKNYMPPETMVLLAQDCFLYDEDGNCYADFQGAYSANNAGNCNPRITGANHFASAMTSVLSRARRHRLLPLASAMLRSVVEGTPCPRTLRRSEDYKILPMNSGCEAIEGAVLLAKLAFNRHERFKDKRLAIEQRWDKPRTVVCTNNFHGRSSWAKAVSSNPDYREPFAPNTMESEVVWVEFGNIAELAAAFEAGDVSTFVAEPIQCEGGMNMPPEGYFMEARRLCDKHDVLLVMDEVQTGLGRTGRVLAQEHYFGGYAEADFIALAKSLSGGQEVASVILAKGEYADLVKPGEHGSTFGGTPKAAATIMAALREMADRDLCGRAEESGQMCLDILQEICADIPEVLEVRGKGLAVGIEIEGQGANDICDRLRESSFIYRGREIKGCWTNSTHGITDETTVIRISPPLTISPGLLLASMYSVAKALRHPNTEAFRSEALEHPRDLDELAEDAKEELLYLRRRFDRFVNDLASVEEARNPDR